MIRSIIPKMGILFLIGIILFGIYSIVLTQETANTGLNNSQNATEGFVINIEPRVALPVQVFQDNKQIDTIDSPRKIISSSLSGEIRLLSEGFLEEKITIGNSGGEISIIFKLNEESVQNKIIQTLEESGDSELFIENGNWVRDARIYSAETWLTGTLVTTNRSSDGEFIIMKKQNQEWIVVYAGTGPSANDFAEINAPRELIEDYYANIR
jgi:hypothetical protein